MKPLTILKFYPLQAKIQSWQSLHCPQELITAILVRLPMKYLLQFKCVSKNWFALISSPHFVKTHLSFSAKDRFLSLFYDSVTEAFNLVYPIKGNEGIVGMVGTVNGLICYCIEKFKKAPDVMPTQTFRCSFTCGFGYDEVHDDNKLVAIFCDIHVKIYSLKSDSWRALDDYQGEMLHWVTSVDDGWDIMSIDLVDEKWRKVEQPLLGSDFYVLCSHEKTDVWVMKEYGVKESWTKLYSIKCYLCELSPPLYISIEGEILQDLETNLTIYNPEDDSMRYPEVTNAFGNLEATTLYIESLVSPVLQNKSMTQH
ncbi:hypothetical protein R3W88_014129 [Solanum pinnatisectum]|uniref:F-box domain-containing protein n=1 Tax=Solanum pinnatisectum TaxID=50273 RepID=A0AAV9KR67_9SOLN|nr:hypothetical protein R3W88_014129 [Solanum pinnatisectum]